MSDISIIIPVLNRWEQTRTCLQYLYAGTDLGFSVIIVDHGSTDGTRAGLAQEFPQVTRLPGTLEMWWTGATNVGIRAALQQGAAYIMLLNNDCYFEPGTLATLRQHATAAGAAVIAPVQRSLQLSRILTRPMTTGFLLGFTTLLLPGRHLYRPDEHRLIGTRLIIGGRGALIPASVFDRVGLLNEQDLPHYGSDHDFYLRCRQHGVPLFIASDAVLDVDEDTTTLSTRLGSMPLRAFVRSLRDRRSHRNLRELGALFRLHYPIPGLYPLGVTLNLARYTCVYLLARLAYLFRH
jgi:GT2 family glycosyltransferase